MDKILMPVDWVLMNEELSENEMLDNFAHQQTLKPEKPLPKSAPEKGSPKVKETKPPEKK